MKFLQLIPFIFLSVILFCRCDEPKKKNLSPTEIIADSSLDNHSYANTKQIRTKHLHLDLDVDFDKKTVYGVARHEMENFGADTAIFDIKA
jgi:hypothetical protein